jgi:hypothetical protein
VRLISKLNFELDTSTFTSAFQLSLREKAIRGLREEKSFSNGKTLFSYVIALAVCS